MMNKNKNLVNNSDEKTPINEKENVKIIQSNEEIKNVELSFPTIEDTKGSQPKKPNALTMRKITKQNKNSSFKTTKKLGDGAFIAAEDRWEYDLKWKVYVKIERIYYRMYVKFILFFVYSSNIILRFACWDINTKYFSKDSKTNLRLSVYKSTYYYNIVLFVNKWGIN